MKNKNILNSFEKRTIISRLKDLNVFQLALATNKRNQIYYVLFFKIDDIIFTESVYYASDLVKWDSVDIDEFLENARKKIGYIIHDVNTYILCKYGDISDKRYQAERIVFLLRRVHNDYHFASICSSNFDEGLASVLEVEITDKFSIEKIEPRDIFNQYLFDNFIHDNRSLQKILQHQHIFEHPKFRA